MKTEFKSSKAQFNLYIGFAVVLLILTFFGYLLLNTIIMMMPFFAIFSGIIAFWAKDRVLITLHDDYIEAKEAIAAKKKLIKYKDITKIEMHKKKRFITLLVANNEGKEKKELIILNSIAKEEKLELFDLINEKTKEATI